ncbi:MAG: hypothetical protein ABR975_04650 [Vulcanimicrobiaceae bacterium]
MSQLVFGPHPTGLRIFGAHIPLVSTSVSLADGGTVPSGLSVVGTGPLGQTASCPVANGQTMTVAGIGNLNVVYQINDCRTEPAGPNGVPERFAFTLTLRAEGTVSIKLIPLPVNVQVDAFDVVIATDPATHAALVKASSVGG